MEMSVSVKENFSFSMINVSPPTEAEFNSNDRNTWNYNLIYIKFMFAIYSI